MKFTIYWTCSKEAKRKICEKLHISQYTSINGETEHHTNNQDDIALLHELQQRKFIQIRNKP